MDHPAEFASPQPWRAAAMVASAIAAVELFILLMVGFIFAAKAFSNHTETATLAAIHREVPSASTSAKGEEAAGPSSKHESVSKGLLPRGRTSVVVLNGNGIPGAAAASADQAHALKYIITATDNAPRTDFSRSLVMFRPGFKAAAVRLAKDMSIKRAIPLDGIKKSDLQGAQLALIIGG
jgi:hypothetical protein